MKKIANASKQNDQPNANTHALSGQTSPFLQLGAELVFSSRGISANLKMIRVWKLRIKIEPLIRLDRLKKNTDLNP